MLLIAVASRFIIQDALPYFAGTQEALGWWWEDKWSLLGHIVGGLLALVLGPFQFWKGFREKYLRVHRLLGKGYVIAIVLGALSATYLAWTSGLRESFAWAFALQVLAAVWIGSTAMAYFSIRRRDISRHRTWMIRSYVITFAFVIFRALSEMTFLREAIPFLDSGSHRLWVSWTLPLLITELVLRWLRAKRKRMPEPLAPEIPRESTMY